MHINKTIAELFGWYGALAIVSAFTLVSFSVVEPDGFIFQFMNLTGALGLIIISVYKKVKQTIILNTFWVVVALVALMKSFL